MASPQRRDGGFSKWDLLITLVALSLLVAVGIPFLSRTSFTTSQKACLNNLKQLGLAFRIWNIDFNVTEFPWSYSTNRCGTREQIDTGEVFRHFRAAADQIGQIGSPKVVVCPKDYRTPPVNLTNAFTSNLQVSYFIGVDADETEATRFMTGDRNLKSPVALTNNLLALGPNSLVEWTRTLHWKAGHIGMADGSVQWLDNARLKVALRSTGLATNRLAIP